jgi:hypothetical protein
VARIESATGILFGKRESFLRIAGFRQMPSGDTDLFNRMKHAGYTWTRATEPTYLYFFGRAPHSVAIRTLRADRRERKPDHPPKCT